MKVRRKPRSTKVTWQTPITMCEFNQSCNAPYGEPAAEGNENIIYSKHCQLGRNQKKTGLNNHAIIIGGPGTGKSRNIIQPNLLQGHDSYVVLDLSGELLLTTGDFFTNQGYDIRILNLMDMEKSNHYNPFYYLRTQEDVDTLVECLIQNTEQKTGKTDPLFEQSKRALLKAVIFYLARYQKPEYQNFTEAYQLLQKATQQKNLLHELFNEVRERGEDNDICVQYYNQFKTAPENTAQAVLTSVVNILAPFNTEAIKELTTSDDMDLRTLGDKKVITYIIVPVGYNPYAFLVSMLYSQIFDTLVYHAEHERKEKRLNHDVCFLMDEFANICVLPDFEKTLSITKEYGICCLMFFQAIGQLRSLYRDTWETIINGCDTFIYLGGHELDTMEYLFIRLKATNADKELDDRTEIKEPVTIGAIGQLKSDHCVVLIKGQRPFYDEKYDLTMHPNIDQIGDIRNHTKLYTN